MKLVDNQLYTSEVGVSWQQCKLPRILCLFRVYTGSNVHVIYLPSLPFPPPPLISYTSNYCLTVYDNDCQFPSTTIFLWFVKLTNIISFHSQALPHLSLHIPQIAGHLSVQLLNNFYHVKDGLGNPLSYWSDSKSVPDKQPAIYCTMCEKWGTTGNKSWGRA